MRKTSAIKGQHATEADEGGTRQEGRCAVTLSFFRCDCVFGLCAVCDAAAPQDCRADVAEEKKQKKTTQKPENICLPPQNASNPESSERFLHLVGAETDK